MWVLKIYWLIFAYYTIFEKALAKAIMHRWAHNCSGIGFFFGDGEDASSHNFFIYAYSGGCVTLWWFGYFEVAGWWFNRWVIFRGLNTLGLWGIRVYGHHNHFFIFIGVSKWKCSWLYFSRAVFFLFIVKLSSWRVLWTISFIGFALTLVEFICWWHWFQFYVWATCLRYLTGLTGLF